MEQMSTALITSQPHAFSASILHTVGPLLPTEEMRGRFVAVILQQVRTNRALQACSWESILAGIVRMAQLKLDPALPNECWLVPFKGQASFIVGYGGLRKLVLGSPDVRDVFVQAVHQHDVYAPANDPLSLPLHQRAAGFKPRGRAIGYYAAALLAVGHWRVMEMSREEVHVHKRLYARSADSTFWAEGAPDHEGLSNFDKMALKTVLRKLCSPRNFSLTPALTEAIAHEEALYGRSSSPRAVDAAMALPQLSQHGDTLQAADDLYGEGGGDRMRAGLVRQQIVTAWQQYGLAAEAIGNYWRKQTSRFKHEPGAMPVATLEGLLHEVLAWIAAHPHDQPEGQDEARAAPLTPDDVPPIFFVAAGAEVPQP
jgi:phage RecT family recombinase